jgi:hypothetical protein
MLLSSGMIMIRRNWLTVMRRVAFLFILSGLLFVSRGAADPPAHDDTPGPYKLTFKGCFSGKGKATVNPKFIMIKADLVDEQGNAVDFSVQKIDLENHRFHDRVNVAGKIIMISGRVDPSGGALLKARINCTFGAPDVGYGRAVGEHN